MRTGVIAAAVAATVAVVAAFGQPQPYKLPRTPIDEARLSHDVRMLTERAEEARPRGDDERVAYIIRRFRALGLKPGGERGGWTQTVPLMRYSIEGPVTLRLAEGAWTRPLTVGRDAVLASFRPVDRVQIESAPLIFLGRGRSLPTAGAGAEGGADLSGKIALVLADAPAAQGPIARLFGPAPETAASGDWTRAVDDAARRGAIGVLVVHDPHAAGVRWESLAEAFAKPQLALDRGPAGGPALLLQGWLRRDAAVELFQQAGLDLDDLERRSSESGFQPVALAGATLSADYQLKRERVLARNIVAKLPGAGAAKETVIYSAHWRPFGQAPAEGASLAALLELARVYAHTTPTRRTIVFAAFADDERGCLGADWYVDRPLYPLAATAADIDIQGLQTAGPARDIVVAGALPSTLGDDLVRAAGRQGRQVTSRDRPQAEDAGEPTAFVSRGVPVLPLTAAAGAPDLVKGGREAGDAWLRSYLANRYRAPKSGWSPDWDLRGAALDIAVVYDVGRDIANSSAWPQWRSGQTSAVGQPNAKGR